MNVRASRKDERDARKTRTHTRELAADKTLSHYLDAMLHEATHPHHDEPTEWPEEPVQLHIAPEPEPEPVFEPVEAPDTPVEAPESEHYAPDDVPESRHETVHSEPELKAEPDAQPSMPEVQPVPDVMSDEPEPEPDEQVADDIDPADLSQWLDNGRPAWAQERFDCLVFVVDGLKLAVPLLLLGNIHSLDRELTPLFDQPDWFLGLLSLGQDKKNIRVVDTARLVMPERYRPESKDNLAYAVGVHGSDWAFGCHAIEGSITLEPSDVKWRSTRTRRPWLAGTVIDQMCALVDLNAFAKTALA